MAKDGGQLVFTRENLWQHAPVLTGTLYFTLDDVDAYCALIRGKVELAWDLEETEYGSREFGLMDCNGYCLAFQQRRVDKP